VTELLVTLLMLILPPCPTEGDSTWCSWDAQSQGNGQGTSFVVIGETVIYVD